jgi:Cytochrome b(C-terminal)/b6/petD
MLCMVIGMIVLVVWGIVFKAPIEEPANPSRTPNPSKAPWYFLGLQEMLVYFDPWLAGVVLPSLIIVGLMAIPYLDTNPKGNGYFTFRERRVEITLFLFGFVILWVLLVMLGTFLRGPNWNFFGPYEYWDLHKLLALNNVNLSEYVWVKMLHANISGMNMFVRELPGILLVLFYVGVLPGLLAHSRREVKLPGGARFNLGLRKYYEKMGPWRYSVFVMLVLAMFSLPIKMVLRWLFNLKYIVALPEIFFNI